jgi:hypothetical protein
MFDDEWFYPMWFTLAHYVFLYALGILKEYEILWKIKQVYELDQTRYIYPKFHVNLGCYPIGSFSLYVHSFS